MNLRGPRLRLSHKLYGVALLLTVMGVALGAGAYFPLRQATSQLKTTRADIAAAIDVDRLGRNVAEWLWEITTLATVGPNPERNEVAAAHLGSVQALRTWESREPGDDNEQAIRSTRSSVELMGKWSEQISLAVERGDQQLALAMLTSADYASATQALTIPLELAIRHEQAEMRRALVRLAADTAAGPIPTHHLTENVLEVRDQIETIGAASALVRFRLLYGQLAALAIEGFDLFDPSVLPSIRSISDNEFRAWQDLMAGDTPPGGDVQSDQIIDDQEVFEGVAGGFEQALIGGDIDGARRSFADALKPRLEADIALLNTVIKGGETTIDATTKTITDEALRNAVVVAALAFLFIVLALGSALAARRIGRRIAATTAAVREAGRNDMTARIPLEGRDELTELGNAFNAMMEQLAGAREEEKQFLQRTVEASESERLQLAAELHDGPIQRLTGMLYRLERLGSRIDKGDIEEASDLIGDAKQRVADEVGALRHLLSELRPPVLEERGLGAALTDYVKDFASRSSVSCDLDVRLDGRVDSSLETTIYRVAQEGLSNVEKHASASQVNLALWNDNGTLHMLLSDDGVGFDESATRTGHGGAHFGLTGMQERVRMSGGDFAIESRPGAGTRISASFPRKLSEAV